MDNIQELFRANSGSEFILTPGEYQGPLLIDRPCMVDGQGATLWQNGGAVLQIAADTVSVKNLRVEQVGNAAGAVAMQILAPKAQNIQLENVQVKGQVTGLAQEAETWVLPGLVALGDFAAGTVNTFALEIEAAAPAMLECNMRDVSLSPAELQTGLNKIVLTVAEMRNNTILYGEIMVKTAVSRRIYITGKALAGASVHSAALPVANAPAVSLPVQMTAPAELLSPNVDDSSVQQVKRGQRLALNEWQHEPLKIALEYQTDDVGLEIDSYNFLLQAGNRVRRDEDLIFFGNQESEGGAVKICQLGETTLTLLDLTKAPADVERIAVCYSIYGDNQTQRFSSVKGAVVRVFCAGKEIYRFALDELYEEKTAVAVEIYRYKGEWKISFIGAGYRSGLRHLCESYGVEIE